ncbi:MAG: hypothetical protein K2N73_06770 [Lachnospiraceae bacterium]|nr:hypothetical protein [Lachnospiraceae bacterium]
MNKVRCVWQDFINNFFSKRLLVFCIFQFFILHYYINKVKQFSIVADYPASPWILPFTGQNVYFLFVYGISVIYFYSNIPFMQRNEMYVLMRQGRKQWVYTKMLRIWLSAILLSAIEWILSILPLLPCLEWTTEWGKLYNSLAMTNAGSEYNVKLFFSYELINEHNAVITISIFLITLCISTGLVGMIMFALSIYINRTIAVLMGTFFSILPVVFANLYLYQQWISFISPFSWLNLLLLYGRVCKNAPSLSIVIFMTVIFTFVLCFISLKRIHIKDLNWIDEE